MTRNRVVMYKRFTDSKYGGQAKALKAAMAWRDATIVHHPMMDWRERRQILIADNTSGYPGVGLWRDGKGRLFWRAVT